ncbi:hypothetical protein NHF40_01915 [Maricaulaceae bacterium EIL42A08]|nr:hypothetical protein [Maricaulaceae bacterium EIL42A08]
MRKLKLLAGAALLAAWAASTAHADQVINDDLIVTFSACIGSDCVNGENFGFDTLRLKENNLRIHFNDTSTSASFPSNDWRIVANDSSNGGANYLAIEDSDTGRIPFRIEAGARANALYVEADSDVGIGTANPVVDLHMVTGNTPTLRLEQDGSSGFTPQVYDIAANEANFFIRDVTNGSAIPFKIRPGADTDALTISSDGDVGINIANATGSGPEGAAPALHVYSSDGNGPLLIEETNASTQNRNLLVLSNNGRPRILFENTAASSPGPVWSLSGGTSFVLRDRNAGVNVFSVDETTGNAVFSGTVTTSGTTCGTGCDAVFDDGYDLMPIDERAELMWANGYLPNVGPTYENEPFNLTEMVGRMLNEIEHAHIYIAQLEERLSELEGSEEG